MHVEAVFARRQAGDLGLDVDLLAGGLERDGAADLAAGTGFERRVGARTAGVHAGAGTEQGGQGGDANEAHIAVNTLADFHWASPYWDGMACAKPIFVASFFWVFCVTSASSLYPNSCPRRTRQVTRIPGGSGKCLLAVRVSLAPTFAPRSSREIGANFYGIFTWHVRHWRHRDSARF